MMAYGELGNRLSFYNISTQSTGIYDILVKAKSLKGESFLMIIGLFVGIIIGICAAYPMSKLARWEI